MAGRLLITRPEHDPAMRFLSSWSLEIIDEAKRKSIEVIDLKRNKAERKKVLGILEKIPIKLAVFNGHGNEDSVTGHDDKIILKKGDKKAVESKIIFARSCQSAKFLGPSAVQDGAIAYLGYKGDFWFIYTQSKLSRPLEDKTAELFLKPSNYVAISLLKGHTTSEANRRSKNLFRKNIESLLVKGDLENRDTLTMLYWDMINQVCVGDSSAVL